MMSGIAEPLNWLRVKGQPFIWDDDRNKAFETLKEELAIQPDLSQGSQIGKGFMHRS